MTNEIDPKVTSAILEDIQERLVELFNIFGKRGLLEQEAQFEIKEMINEWFDENADRDDIPEWLIDNHADDITRIALECLKVEISFDVTPTLVKAVKQLQNDLGE
jgi:hypothetical protein